LDKGCGERVAGGEAIWEAQKKKVRAWLTLQKNRKTKKKKTLEKNWKNIEERGGARKHWEAVREDYIQTTTGEGEISSPKTQKGRWG